MRFAVRAALAKWAPDTRAGAERLTIDEIERGLGLWAETTGGRATLINVSENHTYRIEAPAGRFILRLHRPGYQSAVAIRSELSWLAALRDRLPVPRPLVGTNGELLQHISADRAAVLFAHERGIEPAEDAELAPLFRVLGRYAAIAHVQVLQWDPPAWFERPVWTAESILDANGLWGDWRRAPGVERDVRSRLHEADRQLRSRFAGYGMTADNFGLIHADMRLANLLVEDDSVTLIDFDDSGFCWFVYDLAASLSFIETRSDLGDLIAAWRGGYESQRPLTAEDVAMIGPAIMLRRMALTAWIGSHAETELARRHAPRFAADTAALADRLLG